MLIKVTVHPESNEDSVIEKAPDTYEVFVRARPENNHANLLATHLLSEHLGRGVKLVSGSTRTHKIFKVF